MGIYMNIKVKEYIDSLKGKKVAFVGMGVANVPCAKWLASKGIDVYACDKRDKEFIGMEDCLEMEKLGIHFSLGDKYLAILPDMDIVLDRKSVV